MVFAWVGIDSYIASNDKMREKYERSKKVGSTDFRIDVVRQMCNRKFSLESTPNSFPSFLSDPLIYIVHRASSLCHFYISKPSHINDEKYVRI